MNSTTWWWAAAAPARSSRRASPRIRRVSVCLLEWGPTDVGNDDVLQIRRWLGLLEGPLDLAYRTTLQPRGNAHIVHSRAKVLGGCSSHNTMIWFKPFPGDWQDWVDAGASGWGPDVMEPYYDRIPGPHSIVAEKDRNAILLRLDRGLRRRARRATKAPTGTPRRSATGPASSTSATTARPACAPPRASCTCTRSWVAPNLTLQTESRAVRLEPRASAPPPCTCSARAGASTASRRAARDHRRLRLGRHAAPAAALRHRSARAARAPRHRRRRTTCRASART